MPILSDWFFIMGADSRQEIEILLLGVHSVKMFKNNDFYEAIVFIAIFISLLCIFLLWHSNKKKKLKSISQYLKYIVKNLVRHFTKTWSMLSPQDGETLFQNLTLLLNLDHNLVKCSTENW